jgi:hypothetical protein
VVCETRPCLDSSKKTTPTRRPNSCSFRTQQGANHPSQPHQPHLSPEGHPSCTQLAGRCRSELASVSACEHPTTTYGQCGLLDNFRRLVAP